MSFPHPWNRASRDIAAAGKHALERCLSGPEGPIRPLLLLWQGPALIDACRV